MEIKSLAVEETSFLHLRDSSDELLYEAVGGKQEPVGITLFSPGTKTYGKALAAKNNRMMDRLKKKGKADMTAEDTAEENATFLSSCTKSFHHIESGELQGEALFKDVYRNSEVGFIAEQAGKHLGDWSNFKPGSTTT